MSSIHVPRTRQHTFLRRLEDPVGWIEQSTRLMKVAATGSTTWLNEDMINEEFVGASDLTCWTMPDDTMWAASPPNEEDLGDVDDDDDDDDDATVIVNSGSSGGPVRGFELMSRPQPSRIPRPLKKLRSFHTSSLRPVNTKRPLQTIRCFLKKLPRSSVCCPVIVKGLSHIPRLSKAWHPANTPRPRPYTNSRLPGPSKPWPLMQASASSRIPLPKRIIRCVIRRRLRLRTRIVPRDLHDDTRDRPEMAKKKEPKASDPSVASILTSKLKPLKDRRYSNRQKGQAITTNVTNPIPCVQTSVSLHEMNLTNQIMGYQMKTLDVIGNVPNITTVGQNIKTNQTVSTCALVSSRKINDTDKTAIIDQKTIENHFASVHATMNPVQADATLIGSKYNSNIINNSTFQVTPIRENLEKQKALNIGNVDAINVERCTGTDMATAISAMNNPSHVLALKRQGAPTMEYRASKPLTVPINRRALSFNIAFNGESCNGSSEIKPPSIYHSFFSKAKEILCPELFERIKDLAQRDMLVFGV